MRILIPLFSPPTGTWGGLTRVLAIATAAQQRGHEIAFAASGSLAKQLQEHAFPVFTVPEPTLLGLPRAFSDRIAAHSQKAQIPVKPGKEVGNFWFVLTFAGLAQPAYLQRLVQAQLAAIEQFHADFLFTDADPAAYLTAIISGLPVAGNYATIMEKGQNTPLYRHVERAAQRVLRSFNRPAVSLHDLYFGPGVLKIIPSIPELDGASEQQPDICYTGSLLGQIGAATLTARIDLDGRYVYTYLGTGSLSLETAQRVLPQVFPAGGPLTCLVGVQGLPGEFQLGNVHFMGYVPAEQVLPACEWTICHGGQNTIIQSLQHGVPLMIFPGAIFERRFNARKVVEAGAGCMGEVNQFTPEWFAEAMSQQKACTERASTLAQRISVYHGAETALLAMENWQKR